MKLLITLLLLITSVSQAKIYDTNIQPKREIIALTLLMESRGEGKEGIAAVARSIQNRSIKRKLNLKQVCLQRLQYSCWNSPITHEKAVRLFYGKQGLYCLRLADKMISGHLIDSKIGNADHYHAKHVSPKWARYMPLIAVIGNHIFYQSK